MTDRRGCHCAIRYSRYAVGARRRRRANPRPVSPSASTMRSAFGRGRTRTEHAAVLTTLLSSVTAPLRASARPIIRTPVVSVMLVNASTLPMRDVVVPAVAELPTCQNTLHAEPPLIITTDEALAVVSVLPILKTKTAAALPNEFSVSVPVSCAEVEKQYTPGVSVLPPR